MSQTYTIELKMKRNYGGVITSFSHLIEVDQSVIDEFIKDRAYIAHVITEPISDLAKAINVTTELAVLPPSQPQT